MSSGPLSVDDRSGLAEARRQLAALHEVVEVLVAERLADELRPPREFLLGDAAARMAALAYNFRQDYRILRD